MGGGKSQTLEAPKPVRMPNPNDPSVLAAIKKFKDTSTKRGGRDSTILSTALSSINGSKGALGA